MIRLLFSSFFIILFFLSSLSAKSNIDKRITTSNKMLSKKTKSTKKLSLKLQDVAKEIIKEQKYIKKLNKDILKLNTSINKQVDVSIEKEKRLMKLQSSVKKLTKSKKELEKKIIDIVAKEFSLSLVIEDKSNDEQSVMINEILKKMDKMLKKDFADIKSRYERLSSNISSQEKEISQIEKHINALKKKKNNLSSIEKKKFRLISSLEKKKRGYKKELEKAKRERQVIRKTLAKLKILKAEELKKVEGKKEIKQRKISSTNVRKIGSSYQASRVKRYRGKKTIAPLDSFTVKRKFGNYVDPIYKIKIFNESVILKSKKPNAKVKNILNGKVIFAKSTPLLDNVVIVENFRGIHTVYAHLAKIAPTIRSGKKIKKGSIIGRIDRELTFEVTQKSYHINPLELIKTK